MSQDLTIGTIDGQPRRFGCLPRSLTAIGDGTFPVYGDVPETVLVPEADRPRAYSLERYVYHIIDQGQQGSCCGAMGCQLGMTGGAMHNRLQIILSQASLYGPGNGGRDAGMAIDVCLRLWMENGICTVDEIDQYDWAGYWRKTWPENWKDRAGHTRLLEAWDVPPEIEYIESAVCQKRPVGLGVFWKGGGGHAVPVIGYNRPLRQAQIVNSWGRGWGANGIGWLPYAQIVEGARYFGAFCGRVLVRSTEYDPFVPTPAS